MKTTNEVEMKDYRAIVEVNATADEAFQKIARVSEWWAKNFKGKALSTGDTFTVQFGQTKVDFKITEVIAGKKVVWLVSDCYLHWLSDKKEWNDTKVVWEISSNGGRTEIKMTHVGLVPGVECYADCKIGWDGHVKGSLVNFINEGKGQPE
jgi:hypothetical protein